MRTLLLTLTLGAVAGCPSGATAPQTKAVDVTSEHYVAPPLPTGRVFFQDAYGTRRVVEVEIAHTHESRTRGLMWRRELKPGHGMLFLFDHDEDHSFWMRNTLIPLDMVFLAADGMVVGIIENTVPLSLESRSVGRMSRNVLEVPGGWASGAGLRTGSRVELSVPPGLEIE